MYTRARARPHPILSGQRPYISASLSCESDILAADVLSEAPFFTRNYRRNAV